MNDMRSGENTTTSGKGRRPLSTADLADTAARQERQEEPGTDGRPEPEFHESAQANAQDTQLAPLFDAHSADDFRRRWSIVQQGFVDDPQNAVREGDELVAQVIKSLAESFAQQRERVEGKEGSTEELRLALRRYRSFFERLLTF